jgi:hypothetical protein
MAKQNGMAYTHIGNPSAARWPGEPRSNKPPTLR